MMNKGQIRSDNGNDNTSLSIVVPVYNEEGSIAALHEEIVRMCEAHAGKDLPTSWEIIFVDDGSEDRTAEICSQLQPLIYIRLDSNCGQTAAMDRGFKAAKGDYIAALDADGQNDPADIPRMLKYLTDNDLDAVSGWRKKRRDSYGKRRASLYAYLLRQLMVHDGIHDSGCTLKVYRRECFSDLTLRYDQHRFIPAILKIRGFRIGEIEVNHRERTAGTSKYDHRRFVRGIWDLVRIRAMPRGNIKSRKKGNE